MQSARETVPVSEGAHCFKGWRNRGRKPGIFLSAQLVGGSGEIDASHWPGALSKKPYSAPIWKITGGD
jgi:hypothetical protein